ncbi:MAG: hypothetical protein A2289_15720 [Deltaproteobacteria bacterium RIFOXYA12_FULL_58_15]|nr:MAG: hypothetical protein A2289_15720 [Deltaproteobacteria bacterium RIFOXYA12_FULL_58_15]OGR14879.1 MAG: hypothetical protein A2341_18565 [Deltaproteobacteria bacterium RIFOXYB12_FULL_58_9]
MEDKTSVAQREILLALGNAMKLATSLGVTLTVAFVVRFWMPRFLGPEAFGMLHFAEQFAAAFFVLGTLGAETYIRKEVATRPEHATEFFGSLVLIRLGLSVLIMLGMAAILQTMGKEPLEWRLVYIFAAGQVLFVTNTSLASMLQANGTVGVLATTSAASKILWGGAIVGGLMLGYGLEVVAFTFLATEAIKVPVLYWSAHRSLNLRLRLNTGATFAILTASLPYFINYVSHHLYQKVDVSMISGLTSDVEVGWYGAAVNVTFAIYLLLPVLDAVVLPMGSRIAKESTEALHETMRGAVRIIMIVTMPMAALLALNAEDVVSLLYTTAYRPTVMSLQIMSTLVPVTYICVMSSSHLIQLGRIWTVTKISLFGLAVNPALNALLIPLFWKWLGDGGAGIAAASTTVFTEILVAILFFISLGRLGFDRQIGVLLLRLALACGAVAAVHPLLAPLGNFRGPVEIVLYGILGVTFGALPLRDMVTTFKTVLAERRAMKDRVNEPS